MLETILLNFQRTLSRLFRGRTGRVVNAANFGTGGSGLSLAVTLFLQI